MNNNTKPCSLPYLSHANVTSCDVQQMSCDIFLSFLEEGKKYATNSRRPVLLKQVCR